MYGRPSGPAARPLTSTDANVARALVRTVAGITLGLCCAFARAAHPLLTEDTATQGKGNSQLEMTLDVMAHSLVYWTQDLVRTGLVGSGTRIFAMTSAGGTRALPAYGAVSAAKAALDVGVVKDGWNGFSVLHTAASRVAALDSVPPVRTGVAPRVALRGDERDEWYGYVFRGFVRVPDAGIYSFTLTSDDGSTLAIGDQVVVDHDGYHGAQDRSGQVALAAGHHPVTIRFFQATGGRELRVRIARAGEETRDLPTQWLFHQR